MSASLSHDNSAPATEAYPLLGAGDAERHFGIGPGDLPTATYFRFIRSNAIPKDTRLPNSDFSDLE